MLVNKTKNFVYGTNALQAACGTMVDSVFGERDKVKSS